VQLTWKNNYAKYGQLLEKDLVGHPELALTPEIAVFVLVHGFKTGTFTGRKISDYVNAGNTDFRNARRCINGLDKADQIAQLARTHLAHLDDV
jgi:predicted chitinase